MNQISFDEAWLIAVLDQHPTYRRAVFAASCAERLMTAYLASPNLSESGKALGNLLAWLWQEGLDEDSHAEALRANVEVCMALVTSVSDDGSLAEDASAAVAYTLRCLRDGNSQEAAWAARRAYETVDAHVVNHGGIDLNLAGAEARVLGHSLVQAELRRQRRDLEELIAAPDQRLGELVPRLRSRAKLEARLLFADD